VVVLWIHKLGGSWKMGLAKGSVKERGKDAVGLVGLTAAAVETAGSVGIGGCVAKRIFTGLRGAVGGSSSGTGARSLGGPRCAEVRIGGATLVGVAGLNREPERGLACGMTGAKRLEVRSVYEAGSEGVGLREGPKMSSMDLDG
jgi:hypothetical protein